MPSPLVVEGPRHSRIHRDGSPQNVLVGIDGCSRITDFGVARASSRIAGTRHDRVKGKRALDRDPAQRYQSAAERADGLERAAREVGVASASEGLGSRWRSRSRSNRSPPMLSETREKILDLKRRFEALRGHL